MNRSYWKRKEDWWGKDLSSNALLAAAPAKIIYRIISDKAATINAMQDISLDVVNQVDAKAYGDLLQDDRITANYNLQEQTTFQLVFLPFNVNSPLLQDKQVRRALAHTIAPQEVIDKLYNGFGKLAVGPINTGRSYADKRLKPITKDIEKAKKLLADAGWTDTNGNGIVDKMIDGKVTDLTLRFRTSTSPFSNNLTAYWQENARLAGVQIEGIATDGNTLRQAIAERDFDVYIRPIGGDPVLDDLKQIWHSDSDRADGSNTSGYGDAESDALIDAIRVELDEEKRNVLYSKIQRDIYEEQPAIFLFNIKDRVAVHKRLVYTPTGRKPHYYVRGMAQVAGN